MKLYLHEKSTWGFPDLDLGLAGVRGSPEFVPETKKEEAEEEGRGRPGRRDPAGDTAAVRRRRGAAATSGA